MLMANAVTKNRQRVCSHVQCSLGLGRLLLGVVSDKGGALGQVQMECQQWAMLHADRPQG